RLGSCDQAIRTKGAVISGEMAGDHAAVDFRPWQPERVLRKFFRMRNVKRRRQRGLFTELVRTKQLRDLDDRGAAAFEIVDRYRTVAGSQVNSETETRAHLTRR